ncbi:MAG: beta-ketoacyl-ACP reductase [Legionella sp.]|nr:MAG: beta-ketoacyl-ACP reductase [Legionella sp.]
MKERIALITGGVGDIGTATCRELAQLGIKVIAADHVSPERGEAWCQTQKKEGFEFDYVLMDINSFESCEMVAKDVLQRIGPVDILVNAAGTIQDGLLRNMTKQQWDDVVHTDLDSMFHVTRQFINSMIERKYGRIVNVSSVNGEKGQAGQTNYSSAKSGVYGFSKSLAQEVAKYGITVNTISPGYVDSKMVHSISQPILDHIIAGIPVGRLATPEEIAWSIAFLVSERSGFITGSNLAVNGGIHMY